MNAAEGLMALAIVIASVAADIQMHIAEFERPGVRYCLILDEAQFLGEASQDPIKRDWTKQVQALVDRAAVLIIMSGTLYRGDRSRIAFAPYKHMPNGDEVVDLDHPDWVVIPYARADALRDKAILPIEFTMMDVRGEYLDGGGSRVGFSSFDEVDHSDDRRSREALGIAVHGDAALQVARRMLDVWSNYRKVRNSTAQALIIVDSQRAAKDYLSWVKAEYQGCSAALAISEDKTSLSAIRRYRLGKTDILITVGMAHVGMDAPAVSHIALLAVIRTRGWIEQATARGVRINPKAGPWSVQRCVVYTFDDPKMREIVAEIEQEQSAIIKPDPPLSNLPPRQPQGGGGDDRNAGTIGLFSEATDAREHELNRVSLDREMSAYYERVAEASGAPLTPIETYRLVQTAMEMAPESMTDRAAPVIGRAQVEKRLKDHYEKIAREIDAQRGDPFGTTNRACFDKFGKGRPDMVLEELQAVWPWLQNRRLHKPDAA